MGMEKFHLLPLAENVRFEIESNWADPSFTGIALPDERLIEANGYKAVWNFKTQDDLKSKIHLYNMMEENTEFFCIRGDLCTSCPFDSICICWLCFTFILSTFTFFLRIHWICLCLLGCCSGSFSANLWLCDSSFEK